MNRFHVNIAVASLDESLAFYRVLFGRGPDLQKPDYARWLLDDPPLNFAVKESRTERGIRHVGLQTDSLESLTALRQRFQAGGLPALDQDDTHCCYSRSTKSWLRDPDRVSWETFVTHETDGLAAADPCCSGGDTAAARCCA